MRIIYLLLASLVLSQSAHPQPPVKIKYNPYLFKKVILETLKKRGDYSGAAMDLSFIGDYRGALAAENGGQAPRSPSSLNETFKKQLAALRPVNASDYIIAQAANHQIIIINEAHHKPQHRVFTNSLLAGLYTAGFRYLGLETLTNDTGYVNNIDTGLNRRKYPLFSSGAYLPEPQFGNMVRHALSLGYNVFRYEARFKYDRAPREQEEAENIKKVLDKDPKAKILIHCGYGHASECESKAFNSYLMAGWLKLLTGIDPYTINQAMLTEDAPGFENPIFSALSATVPSVFLDNQNSSFAGAGSLSVQNKVCYDLLVYHPRTVYIEERPDWLFRKDVKKYYVQPGFAAELTYPLLVKAYMPKEDTVYAVPVDIIEIDHPGDRIPLLLSQGQYKLTVEDWNGKTRGQEIQIE